MGLAGQRPIEPRQQFGERGPIVVDGDEDQALSSPGPLAWRAVGGSVAGSLLMTDPFGPGRAPWRGRRPRVGHRGGRVASPPVGRIAACACVVLPQRFPHPVDLIRRDDGADPQHALRGAGRPARANIRPDDRAILLDRVAPQQANRSQGPTGMVTWSITRGGADGEPLDGDHPGGVQSRSWMSAPLARVRADHPPIAAAPAPDRH